MSIRILVLACFVLGLALSVSCSSTTEPENGAEPLKPVPITGSIDYDLEDWEMRPEDLTIVVGDQEAPVGTDGTFDVMANEHATATVMAVDDDRNPVFLAILADPTEGASVSLDAGSTALALGFLHPMIAVSEPEDVAGVLADLRSLDEFEELEFLIDDLLYFDPLALTQEDDELDYLWSELLEAYFQQQIPLTLEGRAKNRAGAPASANEVIIDPSFTQSGHRISYLGDGDFKVTNENGRWALAVPEEDDSFYIFPNGTLVDWIIKDRPFAPSEREFKLEVAVGDALDVAIFGMGLFEDPAQAWADLDPIEQDYVMYASGATVIFEFIPHVLSTIGNVGRIAPDLKLNPADARILSLLSRTFRIARIADRTREYYRVGDLGGFVWFYSKAIVSELVNNDSFRAEFVAATGIIVTDGMVKTLASWVLFPARVVLTANAATSVMKTVLGVGGSKLKVEFEISRQATAFGNVTGTVHDKASGLPIEGAAVQLLGEIDNPLNPDTEDITSGSGGYFFENITAGEKTIRAGKTGYLGAEVQVTVRASQTVTAPRIELARPSGFVFGKVKDDILVRAGRSDPTFTKDLDIVVREVGGGTRVERRFFDGDYEVEMAPGEYWVVAGHDDYFPDSTRVTIPEDGRVQAADLLLKPRGFMTGEVLLDMDGNGSFEVTLNFDALSAGIPDPRFAGNVSFISGGQGTGANSFDTITLYFDTLLVNGPNAYNLGDWASLGDGSVAMGATFITSRYMCRDGDGNTAIQGFSTVEEPDDPPCECGIGFKGSVIIDEYGTELTDPIEGEIFEGDLAGYRNCSCEFDGQNYVVDCARARLKVRFRALVGTIPTGGSATSSRPE